MKRSVICFLIMMLALSAWAVPAKPGLWKTIRLTDGTEVRARLCGDEHGHFWLTEDGQGYRESDDADVYAPINIEQVQEQALARRSALNSQPRRLKSASKVSLGSRTRYEGRKKGLVILAQFTDVKFQSSNNLALYKRILNEEGFSQGRFRGSVKDYFTTQSAGLFELDFDVIGPLTLKYGQKYYGQNDIDGYDMRAEEMIKEVCTQADSQVDYADYDWDGDGEVELVFVIYAGNGEADGGSSNTIWPHMFYLNQYFGQTLKFDSINVNTYACSNETAPSGAIEGIGCLCHEFSHGFGFPDFYDTEYSGWRGMGDFDLMATGSYNGNGFCPPNYTAHEKMMCGWQEPIVLSDRDTVITNLQPMSNHGETFIIYNDAHPDEYFTLENRQKTQWDTSYPAKGLLITHVDFEKIIWENNVANTKVTTSSMFYRYGAPLNDHQRCAIVHADNDDDSKYWSSSQQMFTKATLSTDLYPYQTNDSLTATSKPAVTLYNKNAKGTTTADWGIFDIKQNSDGTMSFTYRANAARATSKIKAQASKLKPQSSNLKSRIFTLDGRYVGTDLNALNRGIYIINGKKIVK